MIRTIIAVPPHPGPFTRMLLVIHYLSVLACYLNAYALGWLLAYGVWYSAQWAALAQWLRSDSVLYRLLDAGTCTPPVLFHPVAEAAVLTICVIGNVLAMVLWRYAPWRLLRAWYAIVLGIPALLILVMRLGPLPFPLLCR